MAESKHTPGPWWTSGRYDGREKGCAIIAVQEDAGQAPGNPSRGIVAFSVALLNTEARRCEANATLIAAAPDMLAALKKAREFITNGVELGFIRMPDPSTPDSAHDTPPMIEAAIAKAEGRSNA